MPDLKPDASGSNQTATLSSPPGSAGVDPFQTLHKMSTTAGVGSADYVAINSVSVAAIFLGLASSLALLDPILLAVPLAGIVCSIVALTQIARSNGTQTGKGLSIAGLLLALLFIGIVGGREVMDASRNHADEVAIGALIAQVDKDMKAENWEHMYTLFGDHFTERVKPDAFADRWKMMMKNPYVGKMTAVGWNNKAAFFVDNVTQSRFARSMVIFTFEKGGTDGAPGEQRPEILLRKTDDRRWVVEDISGLFPQEQQQGPGGGPQGPRRQ